MPNTLIAGYFGKPTKIQQQQFAALNRLCKAWNQKINIISRRDVDNLALHHILHSLSIARIIAFREGAHLLDIGTGGGFPGLPLAIWFPKAHFHLVDVTAKKINVVNDIIQKVGLKNVRAEQIRAAAATGTYDFALSRAVAPLKDLCAWNEGKIKKTAMHPIANGILCLKGGDLQNELDALQHPYQRYPLNHYFKEAFFEKKEIIHVSIP